VKIRLTVTLSREDRLAIGYQHGDKCPASRGEAKAWLESILDAAVAEIALAYDQGGEEAAE
jgi:hypothetical protein